MMPGAMVNPRFPIEGPDGIVWMRPARCYACDVWGPRCPWHREDWQAIGIVVPKDRSDG